MAYTRQQLENMSIEELRRIDRETDKQTPIKPASPRGSREYGCPDQSACNYNPVANACSDGPGTQKICFYGGHSMGEISGFNQSFWYNNNSANAWRSGYETFDQCMANPENKSAYDGCHQCIENNFCNSGYGLLTAGIDAEFGTGSWNGFPEPITNVYAHNFCNGVLGFDQYVAQSGIPTYYSIVNWGTSAYGGITTHTAQTCGDWGNNKWTVSIGCQSELDTSCCEYTQQQYYDCDGNPINDSDGDGFPDEIDIDPDDPCPSGIYDECGTCDGNGDCYGCMDENACNYDPGALFQPEGICQYEDIPNEDGFNCLGECIIGYDVCGMCGGDAESYEECPDGEWEPTDCPQCEGPDAGLYCCEPCAINYCTLLISNPGEPLVHNPTCDWGQCCKCPGSPSIMLLHSWDICPSGCADRNCPSFCEEECTEPNPEDCEEWIEPVPGCRYGGGALNKTWCNEFWNGDTLSTPGRGYISETFSCRNQPPGSVVIVDDKWHSNTYETPYNYNPLVNIDDCSCIIGGTLSPYYHQTQCDGGILSSAQVKLMEDCSLCGEDRDWIQGCPDPKALNYHPYAAVGCIDVACYCGMRDGVPGKMEDRGALDCCQYDQYWNVNWPNAGVSGSTNQWLVLINSDEIANIQLPDGSPLQDGDEIGFFQDVIEVSAGGQTYYVDNYIMNCSNCNEEVAEEFVCSNSWHIPSPGECVEEPEITNEFECLTDEYGEPTGFTWQTPTYCIPDFDNISGGSQDHFLIDENDNPVTESGWYCWNVWNVLPDGSYEHHIVYDTEGDCLAECSPWDDEIMSGTEPSYVCQYRENTTCSFDVIGGIEEYTQGSCLPRCQCESADDCIFELETTNELSEGTCKHNSQAIWNYRIKGYEEYGTPEYWVGGQANRTEVVAVRDGISYITFGATPSAPFTVKIYRKETDTIYDCVHIDGSATGWVANNQFTNVQSINVLSAQECGVGCTDFNSLNCSTWCSQCGCDPNDDGCQECQDDGSCIEHTFGCMDNGTNPNYPGRPDDYPAGEAAYNYNPYATAECTDSLTQNCDVCDYDCDRCVFFGFGGITENENGNPVVGVMVSANSEKTLAGGSFSVAGAYNVVDVFGGMINADDEYMMVEINQFITVTCFNQDTCGQDFVITTEPQIIFYMELERSLDAIGVDDDPTTHPIEYTLSTPDTCFHVMYVSNATWPYDDLLGLVDIGMNPDYPSCFNYQFLEQGWVPGDVNQDGMINVQDVIMIVQHIMDPTSLNSLQIRIADVSQDGLINVVDVLYLVNLIMGNVPYPQQQQVEEELRRAMKPLNARGTQQTPIRPGDSVRDADPQLYYVRYKTKPDPQQEKTKHNAIMVKRATKRDDLIPSARNVVAVETNNIESFRRDKNVEFIEQIFRDELEQINDPIYTDTEYQVYYETGEQYTPLSFNAPGGALGRVNYPEAIETFGFGQYHPTLGLLDGAPRLEHPDLINKVQSYQDPNNWTEDSINGMYHGTAVASIMAAETNNNYGMAGACPNCQILYYDDDYGYNFIEALEVFVEQGVRVVNMSRGSTYQNFEDISCSPGSTCYGENYSYEYYWEGPTQAAITDAANNGLLIINSAGNDSVDISYESGNWKKSCSYHDVFCVANSIEKSNSEMLNYDTSCTGTEPGPCEVIDVSAPGVQVVGANWNPDIATWDCLDEFGNRAVELEAGTASNYINIVPCMYRYGISGTSVATPIVTGLVGLLLSHNQDLSREKIIDILHNSNVIQPFDADPVPGQVDFYEALSYMYEYYPPTLPPLGPGDINEDGVINVSDVMMVVNHIMDGTQLTEAQQQLADVVQNGIINVNDIVYIIYQILDITPQQQSAIMNEVRRLLRPGTRQTPIRPGDRVRDMNPT